jgi:hypothetical protein
MMNLKNLGLGLLVSFLVGCSSKPPDCASAEAMDTASKLVKQSTGEALAFFLSDPNNIYERGQLDKLRADASQFAAAVKLNAANIVQNAYDSGARKFSCSAKFTAASSTGRAYSREQPYSVQSTADGPATYVLRIEEMEGLVAPLRQEFIESIANVQLRIRQAGGPTAAPQVDSACVKSKLAVAERELKARLDKLSEEAEAQGQMFKGMSPVQEEEWQEKNLLKARQECQ